MCGFLVGGAQQFKRMNTEAGLRGGKVYCEVEKKKKKEKREKSFSFKWKRRGSDPKDGCVGARGSRQEKKKIKSPPGAVSERE